MIHALILQPLQWILRLPRSNSPPIFKGALWDTQLAKVKGAIFGVFRAAEVIQRAL